MKFGEQLQTEVVEEWRSSYIDYEMLKQLMSTCTEGDDDDDEFGEEERSEFRERFLSPVAIPVLPALPLFQFDSEGDGVPLLQQHVRYREKQRAWVAALHEQIGKVDCAYTDLVADVERRLDYCCERLDAIEGAHDSEEFAKLRTEFVLIFRRLHMILNFALVNFQAVRKIVKKFDKVAGCRISSTLDQLKTLNVFRNGPLLADINRVIHVYAAHFEDGDVTAAKIALLSKMTGADFTTTDAMRLGVKVTLSSVIVLVVMIASFVAPLDDPDDAICINAYGPVYRGAVALAFLTWMWGIVIQIFIEYRINFIYILGLNPESRLSYFQIYEEACDLTIVVLINMFLFIVSMTTTIPSSMGLTVHAFPRALLLFLLIRFFLPIPLITSHWSSRRFLLVNLWYIIQAPFARVSFASFFIADFLTSIFKVLIDISKSVCIMSSFHVDLDTQIPICNAVANITVPLLSALPLYWRFMQCLRRYYETGNRYPNLPNACKYLVSHSVILLSVFHSNYSVGHDENWSLFRIIWLISFLSSTAFVFLWDVLMDWSLFEVDAQGRIALRKHRLYSRRCYYFLAIMINFFLRFLWTISLIPAAGNPFFVVPVQTTFYQAILLPILIFSEIFRRCMWGVFRVENEHIGNADDFRSHDAPVPMFFDNYRSQITRKAYERRQSGLGIMAEFAMMMCLLVVVGIAAIVLDTDS